MEGKENRFTSSHTEYESCNSSFEDEGSDLQNPADENREPSPRETQTLNIDSKSARLNTDSGLGDLGQEEEQAFPGQAENSKIPSNNRNASGKESVLVSDRSPKFPNDASQGEPYFKELSQKSLQSQVSGQQGAQNSNPNSKVLITEEFDNELSHSRPEQDQNVPPQSPASELKDSARQILAVSLPNSHSRSSDQLLLGDNLPATPVMTPLGQTNSNSQNNSLGIGDNGSSMMRTGGLYSIPNNSSTVDPISQANGNPASQNNPPPNENPSQQTPEDFSVTPEPNFALYHSHLNSFPSLNNDQRPNNNLTSADPFEGNLPGSHQALAQQPFNGLPSQDLCPSEQKPAQRIQPEQQNFRPKERNLQNPIVENDHLLDTSSVFPSENDDNNISHFSQTDEYSEIPGIKTLSGNYDTTSGLISALGLLRTLAFDIKNIIHLIQYSTTFENCAVVEKCLVCEAELFRFGDLLSKGTGESPIRKDDVEGAVLNFERLAKIKAKFVGVAGRPNVTFQALADNSIIHQNEIPLYSKYFEAKGSGLYLLPMNKSENEMMILTILYVKEENGWSKADEKRCYVRLLRYLIQLCSFVILAIGEADISLIASKKDKARTKNVLSSELTRPAIGDCTLTPSKIIDGAADSKRLIATSSRFAYYTKTCYPPKHEIKEDVYVWINNEHYYKFFEDYRITVEKSDGFEGEATHHFIEQNFYQDSRTFLDDLPREVDGCFKENGSTIKRDIAEKIKLQRTWFVISYMKLKAMLEYKWLLEAASRKQGINAEEASRILEASRANSNLKAYEQWRLKILDKYISEGPLPQTDILCTESILTVHAKCGLSQDYQILEKSDVRANPFRTYERPRAEVYEEAIRRLNERKSFIKETSHSWDKEKLTSEIQSLKSTEAFFNNNFAACAKVAITLFQLCYSEVGECFPPNYIENSVREQYYVQWKSEAREELLFQKTKELLERNQKEVEKPTVSIIALKEQISGSYHLTYKKENAIEAYKEYQVYEYDFTKPAFQETKSKNNSALSLPTRLVAIFELSESKTVLKMILIDGNTVAVVMNYQDRSEIRFYNTGSSSKDSFSVPFGQPIHAVDYHENERKFVFCTQNDERVMMFVFSIGGDFEWRKEAQVDLTAEFNIRTVNYLYLGNNNEVFFAISRKKFKRIDYRNRTSKEIKFSKEQIKSMLISPRKDCLLCIMSQSVVIYDIERSKKLFTIPLKFQIEKDNIAISMAGPQAQILYEREKQIYQIELTLYSGTQDNTSPGPAPKGKGNHESSHAKSILDYFCSVFRKFFVHGLMKGLDQQSTAERLYVYCGHRRSRDKIEETKIQDKLKYMHDSILIPNAAKLKLFENPDFIFAGKDHSDRLYFGSSAQPLDRWIQELVSLVPIQIGRTENNKYIILKGDKPLELADARHVYEAKERISYGLHEAILKNWDKSVKVISSLGNQGTGKSHMLNYLSGGTFAIAKGSSTDGCWLTLKITNDCLYVFMDFEGLGRLEKSGEESFLLLLKNAVLSNFILFKTNNPHRNTTKNTLRRLLELARLLKSGNEVFKEQLALLVSSAKDPAMQEVGDYLPAEVDEIFEISNYGKLFDKTKEANNLNIISLEEQNKLTQIEVAAKEIEGNACASYASGKQLLDSMNTVDPKIALKDFPWLKKEDLKARIAILEAHYRTALMCGNLAHQSNNGKADTLRSYDNKADIIEEKIEVKLKYPDGGVYALSYSDPDIDMGLGSRDFIKVLNKSFPKTQQNYLTWSRVLKDFVPAAVKERINRVLDWVDMNLKKWSKIAVLEKNITTFKVEMIAVTKKMKQDYQICPKRCSRCSANCTLLNSHKEDHTCGLDDHKCKHVCSYCKDNNINTACSFNFGHIGNHSCSHGPHMGLKRIHDKAKSHAHRS